MIDRGVAAARDWLLGGNTVARVGLLVLFVGVAFLLRYVAERTAVPIELRLAGVALGGVVFLVVGWRMRERRPGFAVTLQGGAIGILYLTAYAALRLYEVLPPVAAFAFMAALAALSAVLAVLQDARALAALGATGGFLAPLLVATGSGRIELLFSYYLVLNLGVLGVALFRAWRELNWIAFGFTFGVSGLWALQRYSPADYPVGQGFLAAFWLLFLAVSRGAAWWIRCWCLPCRWWPSAFRRASRRVWTWRWQHSSPPRSTSALPCGSCVCAMRPCNCWPRRRSRLAWAS
jgi:uncharacterized membrane protein